jgi:hypothetical protein
MRTLGRWLFAAGFSVATGGEPEARTQPTGAPAAALRVFLDCDDCFADYLREEIEFVDFVRERTEADVHVLVTDAETGGGGREYAATFLGTGSLAAFDRSLTTSTTSSDSDDVVRRQIANMVRVGLLNFVAATTVPPGLAVTVERQTAPVAAPTASDPWNRWVFSVRGSGAVEGEELQRETMVGAELSADRITPDWKTTVGAEFEHRTEHFELPEETSVKATRREQEVRWLIVKSLGEHWSIGTEGELESTTFDNIRFAWEAAPAIEANVFPYSTYTRRQLRVSYAVGLRHAAYYEETLFGRTAESHPVHQAALAYEQTEQWGSLDMRVEWSQYLHDPALSRLEADGEIAWRLVRGLSLTAELNASRVRDQLSLPRRGVTPEEVFLELRQLRSGYEYRVSFGVTYTFGSIFSAIVNPRFGR